MNPIRIQRKRSKGWKMPENTVYVGRPTRWGNRYLVGKTIGQCDNVKNENHLPGVDLFDDRWQGPERFYSRQPYVNSFMQRVGYNDDTLITNKIAVELYEHELSNYLTADDTGFYVAGEYIEPEWLGSMHQQLEKLRGKNLACFCPLDKPCHADVLLEIANP